MTRTGWMTACAASLLVAALTVPAGAQRGAAAGAARCQVANPTRALGQELAQARAAFRDGRALTIVALGSSSTLGVGASSPDASYPAVLQGELARLLPGHDIKVINQGVAGNSALQMFHRMDEDVVEEQPSLVIWQTGVTEAINDIGIDKFKRILRKGIAKLREAGIDVVLMDHQPLPQAERYPMYQDYLAALREVAAETETPVFRRFDVMTELLGDGRLRQDEVFAADSQHMVDGGYYCIGMALARSIAEKLSPRAAEMLR
ncbi:SGNH/GDSL hydrolase family protein [Phreatobacter sp. AB_2022a]|uniref:SGNH/GDSL hydrolase family protein n=1 Tax=Phreatobacter sp. AB_2022a TaxID=3003134 RepID=UPI0022872148|nr:SGNH/GDSL hydrolase family protein [Phreatobacter sp. AB_2022a]MCZ0735123.1 SGNH/GDSL hydrolase family protein [Phreatobacter sp. AB_2022a]